MTLVHFYEIPVPAIAANSTGEKAVVGGWAVEGILGANSGAPLNILLGRDVVGNGRANGQRPDAVLGQDWRASWGNRFTWLNGAAFDATAPACDHRFGTFGFNTARGPGAFSWGVGIHKTIPIREKQAEQRVGCRDGKVCCK